LISRQGDNNTLSTCILVYALLREEGKMKRIFLFLIAGVLIFGNISCLRAQLSDTKTEAIDVEVDVAVLNNDVNAARERALMQAQRRAVELVVGVFVNAATLVGKAQLVDSQIYSKTNGYVKTYEVLSEKRDGDSFKMKMKAYVKVGDVNRDLDAVGLMIKGTTIQNPRIMVLISESIDDAEAPISTSESEISNHFMSTGYRVVENAEVKHIRALPEAKAAMEGDIDAVTKIGKDNKVDVIVIGKAYANFNTDKGLGGFISYRATITAKVVKIDSSEVLYTASKSGAGVDLTKQNAAKASLTKIGELLSEEMVPDVTQALNEKAQAQLTISNIPDWNKLSILNKNIQSMQGVSSTYIRSYESDTGVASIDVNLRYGNASQIASYLSNIKVLPIEIIAVTGNVIEAKVK